MSDTPRTDAARLHYSLHSSAYVKGEAAKFAGNEIVPIDFASTLERDLTAANEALARAEADKARMIGRVFRGEDSDNCPFCLCYPATGHAQQSPQCPLCQHEERSWNITNENARLRARVAECEAALTSISGKATSAYLASGDYRTCLMTISDIARSALATAPKEGETTK